MRICLRAVYFAVRTGVRITPGAGWRDTFGTEFYRRCANAHRFFRVMGHAAEAAVLRKKKAAAKRQLEKIVRKGDWESAIGEGQSEKATGKRRLETGSWGKTVGKKMAENWQLGKDSWKK